MQNVYLVPGFLDTELHANPQLSYLMWCNTTAMILGWEATMELAANGVDPQPPFGVQLYPGRPTPAVWLDVQAQLQAQLGGDAYTVILHGWDFRKTIVGAGQALSQRIRGEVTSSSPATIVGHSAGGLVAWCAWADLVQLGRTDLVRRIVTMGTPFQGTYYPTRIVDHSQPEIQQLLQWNALLANIPGLPPGPYPNHRYDWAGIFSLWCTFPAFSQLFPALWGPLAAADPNRFALYSARSYPDGYNASQTWLTAARTTFAGVISNPANHPPAAVLTCVAGEGLATVNFLLKTDDFSDPASYRVTLAGDGVVETASALYPPCASVTVTCPHSTMPLAFTGGGQLAAWIRDPRVPPDPPPPPVEIVQAFPEEVTPTPPTELLTRLTCIGGG